MGARSDALNIFKPNAESDDPSVFAGRRRQVLEITDALLTEKAVPIIYGERGLGKTSLALQMARIALGDETLLAEFGCGDRALVDDERFSVFWVSCSDETKTTQGILQRLVNVAEGYSSLKELDQRQLKAVRARTKLALKFFESETTHEYNVQNAATFTSLDLEDRVVATIEALRGAGHHRILFIIDELDRVSATAGLANFVKNVSSSSVKFLFVGIAHNVASLLVDHESLSRSLVPVRVDVMTTRELEEVILKARRRIRDSGLSVQFLAGAIQRIARAAAGFPWFVHIFGQATLMSALDARRDVITIKDVEESVNDLANNRFAQQFGDEYRSAVGRSRDREVVLRLFARWPEFAIPVAKIYPLAQRLGVRNPSAARTHLLSGGTASALVALSHQPGLVRFRNAMFKRYCDLRQSISDGVAVEVGALWGEVFGDDVA